MTDYIALALEDQEERENSETAGFLLEQHSTAGVRQRKAREQGLGKTAAEGGGTGWSGSTAETGVRTREEQNDGLAEPADGQTQVWMEPAASARTGNWLEAAAAVLRGSPSGGVLYQKLRQAQTAAEYRPNRTSAALLPAEERNGSVQGLAELDRAFQRDARRYDGGFEFY